MATIDGDWNQRKNSEIIKYIQENHHKYLQENLPEIETRVYKLLRVHYADCGEVLTDVHKLFGKLNNLLELLFVKKRMAIFPNIIDYERNPCEELLQRILKEIVEIEEEYFEIVKTLTDLRRITNEYVVPPSGCPTFDTTYEMLEDLELNIIKNIQLEKDIMYMRLKKLG